MTKRFVLVACSVTLSSLGVLLSSQAEAGYRHHHGHHHFRHHYGHHHHGYRHHGYGHHGYGHRRHVHHRGYSENLEAPRQPAGGSHGGQSGMATWYGPGFYGRRTASGEVFSGGGFTAAHRSLPFGTRVQVTNEANGSSVVVRINDRGPYRHGAVIDLSRVAARALGISGSAPVRLARLGG